MTILEVKIDGFGKHCNLTVNFRENINVVMGNNESGKSTIAAFIRAMLYSMPETDTCKDRKKYLPWDNNAKYGGEMSFEHNGVLYKVVALFGSTKKNDSIILYNVTANENIVVDSDTSVGEMVLGITAEAYDISSYAAQLSSKPNTEDASLDYLFDKIMKKSEEDKVLSNDSMAGKRISEALEAVGSKKNAGSILFGLEQRKNSIEAGIKKINSAKDEEERLRNEYNKMQQKLNEEKDKHISVKTDMNEVARAVETVSLHSDVKKYVKKINELDAELATNAQKSKKTRKPVNIIYIILMCLCIICMSVLALAPQITKISFLGAISNYLNSWHENIIFYLCLGGFAFLLTVWLILFTSICNKKVRNTRDELFITEEDLAGLLGTEYLYGAKFHTKNRETINAALNEHSQNYKRSRIILENEDNKNKMYNDHLALVEEYTEKIAYTKASADALNKTISEMDDIYVLEDDLANINNDIKLFERRYEALLLASDVMEEAYQRWQADIGPEFSKNAGDILKTLSEGRYKKIKVARNFDISVKNNDGTLRRAYNFSGATIDQMYLALRLSLIKTLSPRDGSLPIILDDPFAQYDSVRKKLAYEAVESFAKENNMQVIMTTCIREPFYDSANIISI